MDSKNLQFNSIQLNRIEFNRQFPLTDLDIEFKLNLGLKEELDNSSEKKIAVKGSVRGLVNDEVKFYVEVESFFDCKVEVSQDELQNLDDKINRYLCKPVLSELSLIIGNITSKAYKVTSLLPLETAFLNSLQNKDTN